MSNPAVFPPGSASVAGILHFLRSSISNAVAPLAWLTPSLILKICTQSFSRSHVEMAKRIMSKRLPLQSGELQIRGPWSESYLCHLLSRFCVTFTKSCKV